MMSPATHRMTQDEEESVSWFHAGATSSDLNSRKLVSAWALSVLVHVAALGGMFLFVFPYADDSRRNQLPVAHAAVIGEIDVMPVAQVEAATAIDPNKQKIVMSPLSPPKDPATNQLLDRLARPQSPKDPELSLLGIGGGGGESGDLGRYGFGLGGGETQFFGVGGSARGVRTVVYVVDRSGSMVDTFGHVRNELKRSISALRRSQKFHVIFFNAGEPLENPPRRLVNAIDSHRRPFFEFLDQVTPGGGTRPERALRQALALEPDLIYLLSDGINFDPELPRYLSEWNRNRHTKIYTIAYLDPGGRQMLEAIARQHGGEFKYVSEYDLP